MAVAVKICGVTDEAAVAAARDGGARFLGLVFYPPSPRALSPGRAAELAALAGECRTVGVFVDPSDEQLAEVVEQVPLDILQLHGRESPARVAEIRATTGRRVMKALKVADADDLDPVAEYARVADLLLFDAKPPKEPGRLPGGNGLAFDWRLLAGLELERPWLLSGGLSIDNLEAAVTLCGAPAVDVSSGVERCPGEKDPERIRGFLQVAAGLVSSARATPEFA